MIKVNLDQVVSVVFCYKEDVKVIQESKYFFNLLTKKKHIWVKRFTISTGFSDLELPFNKESVDRIMSHLSEYVIYDESKELFIEKPYARVNLSNDSIKRYYFDLDSQLDNFMKQFEQIRTIRR